MLKTFGHKLSEKERTMEIKQPSEALYQKYDVQAPRYTSYPTVPFWNADNMSVGQWKNSLKKGFDQTPQKGIAIYIHLPFCESLCTFCGCHKHITKRHDLEDPYIEALIKEWKMYLEVFDEKPLLSELHLGGGTPTFFGAKNLERLIRIIQSGCELASNCEMSFEGHPNNTTNEHLQTLYELGFRRVSFGVQDYDPIVQKAINRIQPFSKVVEVHEAAKRIGYTSISHDLVFGLPFQTKEKILASIAHTKTLMPERISLYSYAHVPWIKGVGQRGYDESSLPKKQEKRALYEVAKNELLASGYQEIGMDHFALPSDEMAIAERKGELHRNFMGYTTHSTQLIVGLGMSAISDSWFGYAQNVKSVNEYQELIERGALPIFRGHLQSDMDIVLRKHILNLMCSYHTTLNPSELPEELIEVILSRLTPLAEDGLVELNDANIQVTAEGKVFIRNVCMCFDAYLFGAKNQKQMFSSSV